ncbi:MAG: bifunctional UDP-N-acetylglucosamine diphosphorylase/glucosamine-1-phosphate N-acetyltransferase GlmU [Thermodesulfobacteriota bacterium]
MKKIASIILAAGLGKRMRSTLPKVLHRVCGRPMLFYPLDALMALKVETRVVVIGHGGDLVKAAFEGCPIDFVIQEEQLGTGHAVRCAEEALGGFSGDILILSGDVPLIQPGILKALIGSHRRAKAHLSLVTMFLDEPTGYGRVVRDGSGAVERVVEEKDATTEERQIREVNAGIYMVDAEFLFTHLKRVKSSNAQGEYYLPDLVPMAVGDGGTVVGLCHNSPREVMGVNNRVELAEANEVMRARINRGHMMKGITMVDPRAVYIDYGVKVGRDTTIYPNVFIEGDSSIGRECRIEEGSKIVDSTLARGVTVKSNSLIEQSKVGSEAVIGPLAHLRPGSAIAARAKVGNFVEIKNSNVGAGSKVSHLSYIGDTDLGKGVNVGAGTITCNYDGHSKFRTIIRDGAFIGSDSQLVAPVTVGKGAYIGSGSTITKDVPPRSLALSRTGQKNIEGWVEKRADKTVKKDKSQDG